MTRSTYTLQNNPLWATFLLCTLVWATTACGDGMSPSTNNDTPDMGSDQDTNTGSPDTPDTDLEPCAQGLTRCGDTCVNLDGDIMHCGGCDMACPTLDQAQGTCQSRQCQYTCDSTFVDRDGDLNDPNSNGCECAPERETCDGEDNDCDGFIDEEPAPEEQLSPLCPAPMGASGECRLSACQLTCEGDLVDLDGDLMQQNGNGCECRPEPETCDGQDNDCDGLDDTEDEDASTSCPEVSGAVPTCIGTTCTYACAEGFEDANNDLNMPDSDGCECNPSGPEICDGRDNNCDGNIDEGGDALCEALDNATAQCQGTEGCLYTCIDGFVDLDDELGRPGGTGCECTLTGPEVCDGEDNDCNGHIDDADATFIPTACELTSGACANATAQCIEGATMTCDEDTYLANNPGFTGFEDTTELLCDDIDNNCNGLVDENCCDENEGRYPLLSIPAMEPQLAQSTPALTYNPTRTRAFMAWQESVRINDSSPTLTGQIKWATFNTENWTVIRQGTRAPSDEDIQPAVTWDGVGYTMIWIGSGQRDVVNWLRVATDGQVIESAFIFLGAFQKTFRNPLIWGTGDGGVQLIWLSDDCEETNSFDAACIQTATIAPNGVASPITTLRAPIQQDRFVRYLHFVPAPSPGVLGLLTWQRNDDLLNRVDIAVLNDDFTLGITHTRSINPTSSIHSITPNTDGTGFLAITQERNQDYDRLRFFRMGAEGQVLGMTQPLFTDILDSEATHYLFPEVQRVEDQYLLSYQTRDASDNQERSLYLQALREDPDGDGLVRVGSPQLLLNQGDLSFHSDTFFPLDEQMTMLISTQEDDTLESELKRYVLNKDGERLCLP